VNVNWSDELHALDELAPSRDLWADALARAESIHSHRDTPGPAHGLTRMRSWRRRTAVTVGVALLAAVGAGSALGYHYLAPSPGFSAGLSSLNNLPAVPWPSSLPTGGLPQEAAAVGLTSSQAEQRLRLAQSNLSLGKGDVGDVSLYAFPGNSGSACLFVTGPLSGGICLPSEATANPALDGVAWAAWGSDGPPTSSGPLAVIGLVADNVSEVESEISGVTRSVPIVNNSFYVSYDQISASDTIRLILHYADGSTRSLSAPNPYGDNGPVTKILPFKPGPISTSSGGSS